MFTPLTTGQLAERLTVSRETVRNYTAEFREFLSAEAVGVAVNAKRRYSEKDTLTLATIAALRNQGIGPAQIKEALAAGRLVEVLPSIPSPAEKEARNNVALIARPEYERALDRIQAINAEKAQIQELYNLSLISLQEANDRIARLEHDLGVAEGALAERLPVAVTLRIAAIITVGMLVLVLLAVVLLANRGG